MKLKKVTFLFFLLLVFSYSSFSQNWKSPFFTVEAAVSYDLPLQDARGNVGDFFTFQNYGTSLGWGAQFNCKFGLGPQGQYRPYITLGYAQLEGRDNNLAYIDSNEIAHGYPLKGSAVYNSTPGTSKIIIRDPYVGMGFEYAFTKIDKKKRRIIPFVGIEFVLNVLTGVYRQSANTSANPYTQGIPLNATIKSDIRVGLGGGIGADWRFTKGFGITFGFKYKIANLMGKKSEWLYEENKMNLLDKTATDLNTNLSKDRNIGYMEFYLGACFFVGKTKK